MSGIMISIARCHFCKYSTRVAILVVVFVWVNGVWMIRVHFPYHYNRRREYFRIHIIHGSYLCFSHIDLESIIFQECDGIEVPTLSRVDEGRPILQIYHDFLHIRICASHGNRFFILCLRNERCQVEEYEETNLFHFSKYFSLLMI